MTVEVRPYQSDDLERVQALRDDAFRAPTREAAFLQGGWVLTENGQVGAVVQVERAAQFFGGRSVPCALVRSVAVSPEARGRGWSSILLTEVLRAMRAEGRSISTLYPTAMPVYRRVGYEVAGCRVRYRQPLNLLPRGRHADLVPIATLPADEIENCYLRFAVTQNGALDRPAYIWERQKAVWPDQTVHGWAVRAEDGIAGYTLYTQERVSPLTGGGDRSGMVAQGFKFDIVCRDVIWTDSEAARGLLDHFAFSRALGRDLVWIGPFPDPSLTLQTTQDDRTVDWILHWMMRLTDVPVALMARGYPTHLNTAIDLQVVDDSLPENAPPFRLIVAEGRGTIDPVIRAEIQVDVGALAAMYSGWLGARDAARLGRLAGATDREIDILEGLFHGPVPWLSDMF